MIAKSKVSETKFVNSWMPHQTWLSSVTDCNQGKWDIIVTSWWQVFTRSAHIEEKNEQRSLLIKVQFLLVKVQMLILSGWVKNAWQSKLNVDGWYSNLTFRCYRTHQKSLFQHLCYMYIIAVKFPNVYRTFLFSWSLACLIW